MLAEQTETLPNSAKRAEGSRARVLSASGQNPWQGNRVVFAERGHLDIFLVPTEVTHAVILTLIGEVGVRTRTSITKFGKHNRTHFLLFVKLK